MRQVYLEFSYLKNNLSDVQKQKISIVWFKRDLRVEDHHPLVKASQSGCSVFPLFIAYPEL